MKKITKILSLTVVVASMMTPLALLANNSNSVNVKQEVNEVGSDASVELDNIDDDVEADSQAIDVNSAADNDEAIGDTITSNDCTAEDSGQTTTTWMGITNGAATFTISKDYVSELEFGEVTISWASSSISSTYLKIPNYIVANFDGKKYKVVGIDDSVFFERYKLSGPLTIPASVRTIGASSFKACKYLTALDLSKATSLTTIGASAFSGLSSFEQMSLTGPLTFPASLATIGSSAFYNCPYLSDTLTIPASVTSIGNSAFSSCTGLTGTLSIPDSVRIIQNFAFSECTGLTSLDLSNATSLTSIGDGAFQNCAGLTGTLTIPASVTTISAFTFQNCTGLTGPLTLPASIITIGDSAFSNCTGLTRLDLSKTTNLTTIGNNAFIDCVGLTGSLTIPASVIQIDDHAFEGCTGLTGTLTIPASVTSISAAAFFNIGSQEFKFLSPTPPATLGTRIFGTDVTKTLWVPNAQAKAAYDQQVSRFGLADASYIKFPEIAPTSVDITGVDGPYTINLNDTNKIIATAKADVKPADATNKNVDWSFEEAPTWLKIDADGNIFADDNLKNVTPGKFTFKVKAVCQAAPTVSNITNDIELNVVYAPITSLVIQPITPVNITLGSAPATLTTCKATVSPTTADSSKIKWSILTNKPTWLDIDPITGVISTNSSVVDKNLPASANYTVQVDSTDGTNKSANATLTINFTKPEPTGVTILNLNTTGYTIKAGTKFEAQLDWEVTPDYAKTEVDWKVTGPAGMSIDTSGKITYSPTQILPQTNFTVTCTSKTTSTATTQATSKIEVTPADVDGVVINNIGTFNLKLGENNSSLVTCTATVNPNPGTIQAVTWSIVDRPTWATIDPTTGVVSINDATHTALVDNQQTITVKAVSNQDPTKFATEEFYINFTQPEPTGILIEGLNENGYTIKAHEQFEVTLTGTIVPSYAKPAMSWRLINAPNGMTIDTNGKITYTPTAKLDKHSFQVECKSPTSPGAILVKNSSITVNYADITSLEIDNIAAQNIELGESAKDLVKCNPIINPTSGVDPNAITWSLVNNNFDWLTINQSTGQISTTKQITDASLTTVNATVKAETTSTANGTKIEATKNFTINFTKPAPTGVEILNLNTTGYTVKAGTKFEAQLDWKVTPDYAKTEVDWKLTGPIGMSIDASGKITYSPTQILPQTNFTVTCTSKTTATATTQLTSKIEVTPAAIGDVIIDDIGTFNLVLGEDNPSLVTCTATVNPNPGSIQDVTWSIENKPSWININSTTGVISIKDAKDPTLADKQQIIIVKAVSNQDATKFATKDFAIDFTKPAPTKIEIEGLDDYSILVNKEFSKQLSIKSIDPVWASKDISWSLKNNPTGMNIDQNGKITYTPTAVAPKVSFKVVVTSNVVGSTFSAEFDGSVTVIEGTVENVKIISPGPSNFDLLLNEPANKVLIDKCEANVSVVGAIDKTVRWELENQPLWVIINSKTGELSIDGSITDPTLIGKYTFKIIAISEFDGEKKDSVEISINVMPEPEMKTTPIWIIIAASTGAVVLLGILASGITIAIRKKKLEKLN